MIGELTVIGRLNDALLRPRVLPIAFAGTVLVKDCVAPVMEATITRTLIVHVPLAPMTPPVSTTELAPALAVKVPLAAPVPVHVTEAVGVGATVMPAGKGSVKVVSGIVDSVFGLVSTIDSVTGSFTMPVDGLNVLVPLGCDRKRTASVADAGVALVTVAAPSVAWKPEVLPPGVKPLDGPLAGIVLTQLPETTDVTSSSM